MRLPVLHLKSPVPCAFVVNGSFCGHSLCEPVLPVSPHGDVFISCFPVFGESEECFLPLTVHLSLKDGLPDNRVYGCTLYLGDDGIIGVELCPVRAYAPLPPQSPFAVERALFSCLGRPHAATLYHDNGWRVALEDLSRDMLLLCQPIKDFRRGRVAAVRCFSPADILVTGEGERGPRCLLFTPVAGRFVLIADENARADAKERMLECTQPLSDTAGHEARYSITMINGEAQRSMPVYGFFAGKQKPLDAPNDIVRAFCEAVVLREIDEALGYLTPDLREGMTAADLTEFFGGFSHVYEVSGDGPCTLWLAYPLMENVYRLQCYECECEGNLITNIAPKT